MYATDFSFDASVLWYSALFGICYTVTNIGSINALKHGPVALTASLVGLSLILTTVWGFFFWDAKISTPVIGGQHGNMLMMFATGFSAMMYLFIYLRSNRSDSKVMLKSSWWLPILAGVFNIALNALVMLMALTDLSPSFVYPTVSVGGLAVVAVFSLFVFKEKMHFRQWIGIAVGAVAVVLLSI